MIPLPRKVLITGASGALGQVLRAYLLDEQIYTPTFLTSPYRVRQGTNPAIAVDISDSGQLTAVIDRIAPDAIIHLAAMTGAACESDPRRAEDVNVGSTQSIAMAALELGVSKVVFASSSAVYGDAYSAPVKESDPLWGQSIYAQTKRRAEEVLSKAANNSKSLSTVVLRIFNIFGPTFSSSLITRLENSTAEEPVVLNGLDHFMRDYIHASDVAHAVMRSLMVPLSAGHSTFNIGSGVPLSNRQIVLRLERQQTVHFSVNEGARSYSCADTSMARNHLGFFPMHTVGG